MQTKKGFTIIELMLAMTMVSMLMLAIAMMVMQMMSIMTKGNTFRELNSAGRTINDDFTRTFNSLNNIDGWNGGASDNIESSNSVYVNTNTWGAFCTGKDSYIWNRRDGDVVRYSDSSDRVKLIRISDPAKIYCRPASTGGAMSHLESVNRNDAKELIGQGEVDLRVYDIMFSRLAQDNLSNQSIIKISYVLRTAHDGEINQPNCNPANQLRDYCAINKFELVVRTLGR
ncbi:MAG: prepilin-type N-terminal cleavage/methylation domain-containing protein [bacterium]|nr:prepilin-type N-terminal cleavage/methylation domain-containing protein [bacterium]